MAKIELVTKTPLSSSGPRGVDVYARLLAEELSRLYPISDTTLSYDKPRLLNADLIHFTFFDLFFPSLWMIKSNKPFVITIHDCIPLLFPKFFPVGLRGKLNFFLQKLALKKAKAVITDSVASKNDINHFLNIPQNQIYVVPLAPGSQSVTIKLAKTVRKEYTLPDKFLLYVGDINWNKNIPNLIEAFGKINSKDIHLFLVGKAFVSSKQIPEFKAIEDAINNSGKSELIHLLGFVPSHHLGALYKLATLYIQPSWYEGFGFPVIEALSQAAPVLSSNQGSLPEVGGSHVHYFDPNIEGDLYKKLNNLLKDDSQRTKYVESGLVWVKNFSWTKVAKATISVYEKIIS